MGREREPKKDSTKGPVRRWWSRRTFMERTGLVVGGYVGAEALNIAGTSKGIIPVWLARRFAHATTLPVERDIIAAGADAQKGWLIATEGLNEAGAIGLEIADTVTDPLKDGLREVRELVTRLPGNSGPEQAIVAVFDRLDKTLGTLDDKAAVLRTIAEKNRQNLEDFADGKTPGGATALIMGDGPLPGEEQKKEK